MPTFTIFLKGSQGKLYKIMTATSVNGLYRIVYTIEKSKNPFKRVFNWIRRKEPDWTEVHKSYIYVTADYLCTCSAQELENWMKGAIVEYEQSRDFMRRLT